MPRFSVLIPTFDHGPTIAHAIASVQAQSERDLEILVVGDGAPPLTAEIVNRLAADDPRIRWFANAKGAGHGERWRHAALQQATGEAVCYLADDDLWLPQHLAVMGGMLAGADFARTLHVAVTSSDGVTCLPGDITKPSLRQRMLERKWNCFGPTCAGHTLAAYHRLPDGWVPRPDGMWSDLWFWRQWFRQPWCRFASRPVATTLHFPSPERTAHSSRERCAELARWSARLSEPGLATELATAILADWDGRMLPADMLQAACRALDKADDPLATEMLRWAIESGQPAVAAAELLIPRLRRSGQQAEADSLLDRFLAAHPDRPELLSLHAERLVAAGLVGEGLSAVRDTVRHAAGRPGILQRMALLLERLGHPGEALDAARQAAALKPGQANLVALVERLATASRTAQR